MKSEIEYKRLVDLDPDNHLHLYQVFMSAEDNAGYTLKDNKMDFSTAAGRDYFYSIALGSICSTSHFVENSDVQDWFFNNGYRW